VSAKLSSCWQIQPLIKFLTVMMISLLPWATYSKLLD